MKGRRRWPYLLSRPEQGWSSLVLLLGMLVLLGVSIADSRPLALPDHGSLSATLPVLMLAAGLITYLLARSSLGVVRAHLLGALLAAAVLLLVTGAALLGQSPLPTELGGISERISAVWMRLDADIGLLIAEEITTSTVTVYLVLGALCWTTAQFGAFSVFRYDRGGPAVMAVGTILFLNVGLGSLQAQEDLLPVVPVLAIFATLALLLLMRLQLVQQRFAWARRHISDTQDVGRLFIRTGVGFVLVAVLSASSLTAWATVDAQDVSVEGLEEPLQDAIERLSDLLAFIGVPIDDPMPLPLGAETPLSTSWTPGEGLAFTAQVRGGLYGNYWWGKAEDEYDYQNDRWRTTTVGSPAVVAINGQLQPSDEAWAGGINRVRVTITVGERFARRNLYRPPEAVESDTHALRVRRTPGGGVSDLEYVDVLEAGASVDFESFVRDYTPGNEELTGNILRASATEPYPDWVLEHYLDGADDEGVVGPRTRAMADRISGRPNTTPYDWAVQVQRELRRMDYNTDIGDRCDAFGAFPECLLAIEEGFCQQYATTMVMVMRAMGVPSRFVTGYLQGTQDAGGRWEVPQMALHNWVEVYFPEAGWVRFDPTPGVVLEELGQIPTELQDGEEVNGGPAPAPTPRDAEPPEPIDEPVETLEPIPPLEPDAGPGEGGDTGIFIGLAGIVGLLVAAVSVVLLFRLRRLPEGDDSLAYRGIVSLATRLGYGPHPSQTEYEYASTLSETIPAVRRDLYVVTEAQVQTTYGEHELDAAHRGMLRPSYARIRTALLRLSLRWRR
ncbi:MAG: transglutaminase domain-containing protein [Candidatus Limnocylindrales bacterium]